MENVVNSEIPVDAAVEERHDCSGCLLEPGIPPRIGEVCDRKDCDYSVDGICKR